MDEAEAERRFANDLRAEGWTVTLGDRSHVDVIATHPERGRLVAEVKGHTQSPGTDVDTLYGQLLRRMTNPTIRYAIVVPESLRATVERVPAQVRRRLGVEVWLIPEEEPPYVAETT